MSEADTSGTLQAGLKRLQRSLQINEQSMKGNRAGSVGRAGGYCRCYCWYIVGSVVAL